MKGELHAPCGNCPFLKEGAIDLRPGRLDGIIADLAKSDHQTFLCHKVYYQRRGTPRRNYATCAGAMIYLMKVGRPNVWMRVMIASGGLDRAKLMQSADKVIEPA